MSKWMKAPQNFGQQLTLAEAELKQLAEQPVSRDSQNSVVSEKSSPRANTSNQKPQAKQTQPPQKENQASHTTQPLQKANNSTPKPKQATQTSRKPDTKTTVSPQKPKKQAPSPPNRQSELKQSTFSTQKPPNIVFNNLESGDSVGFESTDDDLPKFNNSTPKPKQATQTSRQPDTKTTVSPQKPKEQAPSPSNRQSELKQSTFSTQKPPNIVFNNLESGDSVGFESTDDDLPKFKPTYEHEVPLVDTENSNLVKTSGLL